MLSLPELVLKVKVDDSGAKTGLNDLQKTANNTTGSMSKGFSGVGNIIKGVLGADIIKKFAGALVDLGKQTIQLVSDYEQLEGGMKKIFDQADQEKILKDAQNAWEDLNMSANDYLSSINQVGASFAQTMGDQKGYDVARQGMLAIADYASGTGRNLDELNEKYKMITRSTSSYQTIADQFSGLLPATSKDFLAQAQAAGFLSDEYTKLTEVPVAEYQEAVTNMLEKGTKDMGLYGNTAAETAKTISGSLAGMKSAWQNMLTALGTGDEKQLKESMKSFTKSLGNVVKNLGPAMVTIGKSLVNLLYKSIKDAIKSGKASDIGKNLLNKVTETISNVAKKLPELIPKFIKFVLDGIHTLLEKVQKCINSEGSSKFIKAAGDLIKNLAKGLVKAIPIILKELPKIILAILKLMGTWAVKLVKIGIKLIKDWGSGLIEGLGAIFAPFINKVKEKWEAVKSAVKEKIDAIVKVWEAVKFTAKDAVVNLKDKVTKDFHKVKKMWEDFKADPKEFLLKAKDKASKKIQLLYDLWCKILGLPTTKEVQFTVSVVDRGGLLTGDIARQVLQNLPRHRAGLDFIPKDEYPALLHYGEAVLSRSEANAWRKQQAMAGRAAASRAAEQPIIVNTDLYIDGRKIASTTAPYMKKAIDKIGTADNRQLGLV